jgi:hypothetical protein
MGKYANQIDDRPWWDARLAGLDHESQVEKLIAMYQMCERQCKAAERRKAAPERMEFDALVAELERTRNQLRVAQEDVAGWKRTAERLGAENADLKAGTRIPWLERKIAEQRETWYAQTRRIGDLLEHHGNMALLEENMRLVEASNCALRERLRRYEEETRDE